MPQQAGALFFIGVGGIGMSGLAEILHTLGYQISGSDANASGNTARLQAKGIEIHIGHSADNLKPDTHYAAVVCSTAIKPNNPEIAAAKARGIAIVHRADILAGLARLKWSIGVAGTHGKTTTTSMLGTLLEAGNLDPTVINGGVVNAYGTNVRLGKGEWLVAETDESDGSFLKLPLTAAIITNVDPEHLDHYGSADALYAAFTNFIAQLPFYGFAAICLDHPFLAELYGRPHQSRLLSYGFSADAETRCHDLVQTGDSSRFNITTPHGTMRDLELHVPGKHNVQNATGAVAIARELGLTEQQIRSGLANFTGVKRRFTTTGVVDGVRIIDDYAHHPAEIAAVIATARSVLGAGSGRILAIMQPHRFTRLRDLFSDFTAELKLADKIAVLDVYAASEQPIAGITGERLAHAAGADYLADPADIATWVKNNARAGDLVLCLGAGSISAYAHALPDQLARNLAA